MSEKLNITKNTLYNLYIKRGLSTRQVAKKLHCWNTTIANHLKSYGIPLRNPKSPLRPDKTYLYQEYVKKRLSPYTIANNLKCDPTTIRNWLIRYKFPIRKKKRIIISKVELEDLYLKKRLSLSQIAQKLDANPAGILGVCRRYGIKLRTTSESSKYFLVRKDFDGNDAIKAYMIGFRLGDLHVRKTPSLIRVGGGTTIKEQVVLFVALFGSYGKVYIGKQDRKGAWHPEIHLNQSFSFLLPKHEKIPTWIRNDRECFLAFLGGYTDAEGNIGCYPRARFKITSYDYEILKELQLGIQKYLRITMRLWMEKTDRKTHNKDALSLIANEAVAVMKLLEAIKPFLKHKNRIADLEKTLPTIYKRLNINER